MRKKRCPYFKIRKHIYIYIKNIFKHTHVIGEGERLTGGLATLAIIVLVSFSYCKK